jgi:hypothetical protein
VKKKKYLISKNKFDILTKVIDIPQFNDKIGKSKFKLGNFINVNVQNKRIIKDENTAHEGNPLRRKIKFYKYDVNDNDLCKTRKFILLPTLDQKKYIN